MTSSVIVGTPNLVLLGAGASKPYGKPLMGEFVRSFRYKGRGENKHLRGLGNPSSLLNAICDKQEDLEFLIEELDALSSRGYLEEKQSRIPLTSSALPSRSIPEPIVRQNWPEFSQVAAEARKLLSEIKREVYLEYRSIPTLNETSILAKPISLLQTNSHPTVVFTTNYDPAVEKFCAIQNLRLTDGFVHDERTQEYVWNRAAFDGLGLSPNSLVLFKLHGSANWHLEQGRIVKGPPTYDADDPNYQNVMIYPATRKVAIEDPFFTAYDYLEQCLDKADSCLVIGYSFRDYDTLMRFKSAKLSNRNLRIAVLDPNAEGICRYLEQHGILAYPIGYALGGDQEAEYLPLITSGTQRGG
jgi:hypothetical protein